MPKLNSNEIIKLLGILIGGTEPIGETYYDEKVMENLKTLIDITNWCLDGVEYARDYLGRNEYSMHKVGYNAQCAMQDWLKWLNERVGEDAETD